jgi:outer membrane protein
MIRNTTSVRSACIVLFALALLTVAAKAQNTFDKVRHLTLQEAKANAARTAAISSVAELEIKAAKYHRQAAQADYFPKLSADFMNLHYNKFLGQTIQVISRRTSLPVFGRDIPLFGKDETAVALTFAQPVTQLLQVRQAVTVASADERIAQAKAAQLATQNAESVERVYFGLLIAQRHRTIAEAKIEMTGSASPMVSTAALPLKDSAERDAASLEASKELVTTDSEVSELTYALNTLIGFPPDTKLVLAVPDPATETVSLTQATQQAVTGSPEVIEAEETLVKAKAASKLSKLEYVPAVAVVGGYVNQSQAVLPLLPGDFSFIGVTATLNIFDFGKREKTIEERKMQVGLAEANVAAVKAKVAANVQKSYFELQRTQKIRDLTRRLASAYQEASLDNTSARAAAEAEMFQAELDYRSAYIQFNRLLDGR